MRCLALAQAWQSHGGTVVFVIREVPSSIDERLKSEQITIIQNPCEAGSIEDAQLTASFAKSLGASWIVIDGYNFGSEYQKILQTQGFKILAVDDFGHAGKYSADIVVNQNVYANNSFYTRKEPATRLLLGPEYALIRNEFLVWRDLNKIVSPIGNKILITLGGFDPKNISAKVIDAIDGVGIDGIKMKIVVGKDSPNNKCLWQKIHSCRNSGDLIENAQNMPELMSWADIAFSAGGSTNLEMAFMKLPSITINFAQNQVLNSKTLDQLGVVNNLGCYKDIDTQNISRILKNIMISEDDRKRMVNNGRNLVDGKGCNRIIRSMREVT